MQRKFVLLGYMGSGKTSIGRKLANELKLPFWDLDEVIGQMFGMSVPYMIMKKGEIYFRECEQKALNIVLQNSSYVLASGGGTPCYYDNIDIINLHSTSIYFQCTPSVLANRLLAEKQNRPLIADIEDEFLPEYVAKHLFERTPYYEKAHLTIEANGEPDVIVGKILEKIQA